MRPFPWLSLVLACSVLGSPAKAADPAQCRTPHLVDVGWTDITLTTALTASILEGLGYSPKIDVLGTDVAYEEMKNKKVDIFLGTWLPGLALAAKPSHDDGSVETVRTNLVGAKFTLAVPKFVYDNGVKTYADLERNKDKFGGKIYGVEPGGNKPIEDMIAKNAFGLGSWNLVESSEQGMLTQVQRSIARHQWIVFLGWAPHPMNNLYQMDYLEGGDDFYGAQQGASVVNTDARTGYVKECPNIGQLLKNLEFSVPMENAMMGYVINDKQEPLPAALKWVKDYPQWLEKTLLGVDTIDGKPGLPAVKAHFGL